jgi:hypothetical protein
MIRALASIFGFLLILTVAANADDPPSQPWQATNPNGGTVTLAAGTTSASTKFATSPITGAAPAPVAWICNTGSVAAYIAMSPTLPILATVTAGFPIQAQNCVALQSTNQAYLGAITASGTTTITASSGSGTPAFIKSGPWQPVSNNGASSGLNVTTTSNSATIPKAGASTVFVCNTGSNDAYLSFTAAGQPGALATVATGFPVLMGQCYSFNALQQSAISAITGAGATTLTLSSGVGNPQIILPNAGGPSASMRANATNAVLPDARTNLGAAAGDGASINPVKDGYGAVCDDNADDTIPLNNAIAALMNANGGTLVLPGMCKMSGAMVLPFTGTAPPFQKPLRITSLGGTWNGGLNGLDTGGGGGLDLQYNSSDGTHVAKIDTRGNGFLEVDHLTIKSGGNDAMPFFHTTNTTMKVHHNHFIGKTTCTGTNCAQDVVYFGGTSSSFGGTAATNAFQGYGTKFSDNLYSYIRRVATFRSAANAIVIDTETIDKTCGSSEANGAPFMLLGTGLGVTGNTIRNNIVEMNAYPYLASSTTSGIVNQTNLFIGNGAWDDTFGVTTLGGYYFDAGSTINTVINGYMSFALEPTAMAGPGAASNTFINGSGPNNGTSPSNFPGGITTAIATAIRQVNPSDPTGTTSGTGVMMGLGVANATSITPAVTGKVALIISGDVFNAGGVGDGVRYQASYGSGTPPVNGAAITGTQCGAFPKYVSSTTAGKMGFAVNCIITGLTVGTIYWIDLVVAATVGGTATVENVSVSANEIR